MVLCVCECLGVWGETPDEREREREIQKSGADRETDRKSILVYLFSILCVYADLLSV